MKNFFLLSIVSLSILTYHLRAAAYVIDKSLQITQNTTAAFEGNAFYKAKYGRIMTKQEEAEFHLIHSAMNVTIMGLTDPSMTWTTESLHCVDAACGNLNLTRSGSTVTSKVDWKNLGFGADMYSTARIHILCDLTMESSGQVSSNKMLKLNISKLEFTAASAEYQNNCKILQDYFQDKADAEELSIRIKGL